MNEEERKSTAVSVSVSPPAIGFSKGTKQGIWVCLALIILLAAVVFLGRPSVDPAEAIFADLLLSLTLSVAGVWVVGGMIEFSSKLYDVGVKAAGGIAILLLVNLYAKPFATSPNNNVYSDFAYEFKSQTSVGDTEIVELALAENPPVKISAEHADLLRSLAPNRSLESIEFIANHPWPSWLPAYIGTKDSVATQLLKQVATYASECVTVEGPDANGITSVTVSASGLESEASDDGRTILRCKS